ncbi:MAG TPA: Gfo/Idh/MocA family oxidoreductase, partial [Trueperaceae bacterium]|nr:Gfo/Idh/MocA family oxidoreductase [Trueperaceae bacterium]
MRLPSRAPRRVPRRVPRPPGTPGTPVGEGDPLAATGSPLRWGVVSTGKIAGVVTAQLALLEDARLQAVSSRDPAKAADFAARFGFSSSHGDGPNGRGYEALAADPDVDVVYVATPHGQHHAVAKTMLLAGKHVLIEKALSI